MAKLDGVKTLDMVNGEITKVAYGGAEYERVEGGAKVGDIVLITTTGWTDAREGEFYKAVGVDSGGDAKIKDDRGLIDSHFRCNYDLLRKVSASTDPSLEERVSSAEGEIESLKSDVAALKGDDEPKPERLKVGDYAKVVDLGENRIRFGGSVGDVVKVADVRKNQIRTEELDGGDYNGNPWAEPRQLVRATDEEVAEAKDAAARAKFKRGDKVRLLSGAGDYPLNGFENGKIYEVSDNSVVCVEGRRIRLEGGDCLWGFGFATPDQLEILSEEEAAKIERKQAEEAKWAKIGRKVGEYEVGDVVRYDYGDNEICEVVDDTEEGRVGVQTKEYGICREKPANLRLITPVEARFDR
ncbi:hypothetical protein [Bacillus velezensis]|uniref:hypothetical protein n=1 Tax=Bacillus velezensis TaxID=492670 RepID=UPI001E59111A|nr:hypothetical protein [Bacillus velezensis]